MRIEKKYIYIFFNKINMTNLQVHEIYINL